MSPRVLLGVAGLLALVLAAPAPSVLGVLLVLTGLIALGTSVLHPGSTAPAVLIAVAAVAWLSGGGSTLRLVLLALTLAVVHSAAALAAVVPARGRVPVRLTLRWAGWAAAATAVGGLVVAATGLLPTASPVTITVVAVLAVGAAAAAGWAAMARR